MAAYPKTTPAASRQKITATHTCTVGYYQHHPLQEQVEGGKVDRHVRFAFETSKDPMGSSDCGLGGTHVSTGLKLNFRRRGAGLSSEPCSQDSMELTLFSDMMAEGGGFQ